MGLFDREDYNFNSLVSRAKISNEYFARELSEINLDYYKEKFRDEKILGNILYDISIYGWDLQKSLDNILVLYNDVVKKDTRDEKDLFKKIYDFFNENVLEDSNEWNVSSYMSLSSAFDNKEIVLEALNNVKQQLDLDNFSVENVGNLEKLISYPLKARMYYIDDRALLSSYISLLRTDNLRDYLFSDTDINRVINKKIKEDKKQNGIYDIDRGTLAEINHKLDMIEAESSNLKLIINTTTSVIAELKAQIKMGQTELTELKISALNELQIKANKIIEDFNAKYLELLNEEKDSINAQKLELFASLERELSKKKEELKAIVSQIGKTVEVQIGRINATGDTSVDRIEKFVNSNKKIKELVQKSMENDEYLDGLRVLSKQISTGAVQLGSEGSEPKIIVPNVIIPEERIIDPNVNYFFDNRIPFGERFESFQKAKEREQEKGGIFHERFDDVAKLIMKGQVPYMYGPSGCGKTFMIEKQLADLLNSNVVTNGYVLYEQDIIGYTNSATGQFVPGNFYRCYKYGDTIFLDELDNGIANATVVLNRFLGKNNTSYTFPDGVVTERHPNFRIIAAGNTNGSGRTTAHNTRQKMDESVMQRLTPVNINYDNRVEEQILKDYPDWYNFAVNFRKAVENMSTISGETNTIGTFTTRDAQTLKENLDDDVFDMDKLLEFQFIQTKDTDTLNSIYKYLNNLGRDEMSHGSEKILRKFNNMVEPRIKGRD